MGVATFKHETTNITSTNFFISNNNMYEHATSFGTKFGPRQSLLSNFEVPLRNYRRSMKPRLPRKISAASRINLNRFWNELEEFYDRYDDRKAKNNNNPIISKLSSYEGKLPAYTTDTFDHEREAAENIWNERLEASPISEKLNIGNQCCDCCCSCTEQENYYNENEENLLRDRMHSCGLESESFSLDYQSSDDFESEPDSDDEIFDRTLCNKNQQHHWSSTSSTLPQTPRPPKTLFDLIHRMGPKAL